MSRRLRLPRVLAWTVVGVGLAPFQPGNRAVAADAATPDAAVADAATPDAAVADAAAPDANPSDGSLPDAPMLSEGSSGGCGCGPVA